MYNYRFLNPDGSYADRNAIDRELCVATDYPYSDRNFCPFFVEISQWLGLSILIKCGDGASKVTPEMFDRYRTLHGSTYGFTDAEWLIARDYLSVRYQLEMWYGR